ncbi:hypothetical protein D3C73_1403270 [compost metagenome]
MHEVRAVAFVQLEAGDTLVNEFLLVMLRKDSPGLRHGQVRHQAFPDFVVSGMSLQLLIHR